MTRYAIVSQHNWRQRVQMPDGRICVSIGFRAPPSMAEADGWPGTKVLDMADDAPPPVQWGYGTYAEVDGQMTLVAHDFDTSG